MPKIIHLDENHELLKNELEKLGFKNHFDLISKKKEVEKKVDENETEESKIDSRKSKRSNK